MNLMANDLFARQERLERQKELATVKCPNCGQVVAIDDIKGGKCLKCRKNSKKETPCK
jgi:predicted RNA-binding Zn-ribbon protein involved in translation (DUF1610 family)